MRVAAARALGNLGDARAVDRLVASLEDASSNVRKVAADALRQIGDGRVVGPLIAALKDQDEAVRGAVIVALGDANDARAVGPLIASLTDRTFKLRTSASEALDEIGWIPGADAAGAAYWSAKKEWAKCVEIGGPAVNPLIELLRGYDKPVREAAAKTLVCIYQTQPLSAEIKSAILAQSSTIAEKHADHYTSSDCGGHYDQGIGVAFP